VDFAAGAMEAMDEIRVFEMLASLDYIDGLITNVPSEWGSSASSVAEQKKAIVSAAEAFGKIPEKYGKPIVAQKWFLSEIMTDMLRSAKIPVFYSSEDCARAMYALVKYAEIKNRE
jgi:acyl-CoA synthetase (NDP forming)